MQRVLRILSRLDLKHNESRRARISRGYKAGEFQPHYLIQLKYKTVAVTELTNMRTINRTTIKNKGKKEGENDW